MSHKYTKLVNSDDDNLNSVSPSSIKLKVNAKTPELIHLGNLRNDTNDSNLSRRGKSSPDSSPVRSTVEKAYITYEIADKDSLSAIALKFRISVTELKQVNKIVVDSDFFTRKTLKIPVQKHSFLLEETEKTNEQSSPIQNSSDSTTSSSDPTLKLLRKNEKSTQKITEKLQNIQNTYQSSLPPSARSGPILPPIEDNQSTMRFLRGSNEESPSILGNWKFLLACMIIGLVVGPFVYGYLYKVEHDTSTNSTTTANP